jgi:DNA-binding CsgD family transcriptional regulator
MFETDMESNLLTAEKRGAERIKKQWDAARQKTMLRLKAKGMSNEDIAETMELTPDETNKLDKKGSSR